MGWFVAKGRAYPSLVACVVGATVGITLGSLVVPSANDRIAADTDSMTTHTVGKPSSQPAAEQSGRTVAPHTHTPRDTPSATADGRPSTDGTATGDTGDYADRDPETDLPESAPEDGDPSSDDDSGDRDDSRDERDDDASSTAPDPDPGGRDTPPPDSSDEPDEPTSTDGSKEPEAPDEPDEPDDENGHEPDEPDQPGESDEPDEPEQSAPPTLDIEDPEPIPTDPEEREKYCLGLDLSLLELLLCLG